LNHRLLATAILGLMVAAPLWATLPAAAGTPPSPTAAPVPVAVTPLANLSMPGAVLEAAYSPDGQFLAVAIEDGPVRILNATDHSPVVNLTTSPNWISPSSISWGPASDKLAVGYTGGAVAVWRVPSGLWAWTKSGLFYEVKGISWSPDGRFLAAGVVNSVFVYAGENGNLNATMHMNYGGSQPAGLSWSHDSDYIAVGQQAYSPQGALLVVFTSANWGKALQWRWDGPLMDEVAFEGRARYLSVQLGGSRVEVWTVRNWTQFASLTTATGVDQSGWTSDGSRLVMLEREPSASPNTTEDMGGFDVLRLGGGTGEAVSLAASPDGRRVAIGESTGTLRVLAIGSNRFWDDATPLRATTGEPLAFDVRYTGATAAAVHWRDAAGAHAGTAGLALSGGRLAYTLDVPSGWDGPLYYHFEAPADGVSSPERLVQVTDNDPPVVLGFNFTRTGARGETAVARVAFTDNLQIGSSSFTLAVDGVQKASAAGDGTATLNFTLSVPVTPANSTVRIDLDVVDTSGNGGRLLSETFDLEDLTPPVFGNDLSLPGTAGGRIQLGVEARDERGTPQVTVTWRELTATAETEWINVTMGQPPVGSVAYILSMPVGRETVAVEYSFRAVDGAGNANQTAVFFQTVADLVPPEVVIDLSDREASQGHPFNLSIVARDNIGVASASAILQEDGGPNIQRDLVLDNTSGTPVWKGVHGVHDTVQTLSYQFSVTDVEGNSIVWGYRTIRVRDLTPPTVAVTNGAMRVLAGDDFTLTVRAQDADAVTAVVLYYGRVCTGPFFSYQIPMAAPARDVQVGVALSELELTTVGDGRPFCFYLYAHDKSQNIGKLGNATHPLVVEVLDGARPDAQFVTTGQPVVGRVLTFDGTPSTDDLGIVAWQWTVDGVVAGNRSVLEWRFTEAGEHTVELRVHDAAGGEDASSLKVTATPEAPTTAPVGDVLVFGLVAALAAGVAVVFMLFRRRPAAGEIEEPPAQRPE
jgi:hypothetical protein